MKVLLITTHLHKKNLAAIANYGIEFDVIEDPRHLQHVNIHKYDCVYSPAILIDPRRFPHTRFIFGPHVSVFPTREICAAISGVPNAIYVQPSEWARDAWTVSHRDMVGFPIEVLPFGVDTARFCPGATETEDVYVFIYFKRRHPSELAALREIVEKWAGTSATVRIFDYVSGYKEEDYLDYLKKSSFGIWLGSHESQGFALEEALSCNVPLLVWDATKMSQEFSPGAQRPHPPIPCTSAPYWDSRCGEKFTQINEFPAAFSRLLNNLDNYRPREYILENLTHEKCAEKFAQLLRPL